MSYAPFPPFDDGSDPSGQNRSAGFRLSDAEQIAAVRLETTGDGSLKEALAGVGAPEAPRDEVERLTDQIEAAQSIYHPVVAQPLLPFLEPLPESGPGEPPELTLLGLREWGEARAQVASELADMQAQPLFLQEEARQMGVDGTRWQRVQRDTEPYRHPLGAAPMVREEAAQPEPLVRETPSEATASAPIADDATTKLADVNAAAEAFDNLTRLLHSHQRPATVVPAPTHVAQRQAMPAPLSAHPQTTELPRPHAVVATSQRPAPVVPVAQRVAAPPLRSTATAQRPAARPANAPMLRPVPVPHDARQFDLRGFMAGFALSWAIGAVLYIYLLSG